MKKINHLSKRGFTLIEMLIVLLVVSLLMAIIIPNISGQRQRINDQARVNISEVIESQVNTYQLVNGNASVSLTALYTDDYITERQLDEAQNLLGLTPEAEIVLPIVVAE